MTLPASQSELFSERLLLRPFNENDAAVTAALAGDQKVIATTFSIPEKYTESKALKWIKSHQDKWLNCEEIIYGITTHDSNQIMGAVSLFDLQDNKAELGYWIGVPYWNNGYATEAAETLIANAFTLFGLTYIHARYVKSNPASGAVLKKLGMSLINEDKAKDRYGNWVDYCYCGIHKSH